MKVIFANEVEKELVGANIRSFNIDKAQRNGVELLFQLGEDLNELLKIALDTDAAVNFVIKNGETEEIYEGYNILIGAGVNYFNYFDPNEEGFVEKLCCHISLCKKSEIEKLKEQLYEIAELIPEETIKKMPDLFEKVMKVR